MSLLSRWLLSLLLGRQPSPFAAGLEPVWAFPAGFEPNDVY